MTKALSEMSLEELWHLFPIELVPPRQEWPQFYAEESSFLKSQLPENQLIRMEHIGSTAIGTIWAKPIVDILWKRRKRRIGKKCKHGFSMWIFMHEPVGVANVLQ